MTRRRPSQRPPSRPDAFGKTHYPGCFLEKAHPECLSAVVRLFREGGSIPSIAAACRCTDEQVSEAIRRAMR